MLSSKNLIPIFFLLTALFSLGSANGLAFWVRQGKEDGGKNRLAAATTNVVQSIVSGVGSIAQVTSTGSAAASSKSAAKTSSTKPDPTSSSAAKSTKISSSSSTPSSTSTPSSSAAAKTTPTSSSVTSKASTAETTIFTTIGGSSTHIVSHKTSSSAAAASTGLQANNQATTSGGANPNSKSIAIGVGVGVGGAILLGGLAVVAWRLWGRKRHNRDEDTFLMSEPVNEKTASSPGASPFKSTLDQYHNPTGRLNTASNF